jgi:hypothetical protein
MLKNTEQWREEIYSRPYYYILKMSIARVLLLFNGAATIVS